MQLPSHQIGSDISNVTCTLLLYDQAKNACLLFIVARVYHTIDYNADTISQMENPFAQIKLSGNRLTLHSPFLCENMSIDDLLKSFNTILPRTLADIMVIQKIRKLCTPSQEFLNQSVHFCSICVVQVSTRLPVSFVYNRTNHICISHSEILCKCFLTIFFNVISHKTHPLTSFWRAEQCSSPADRRQICPGDGHVFGPFSFGIRPYSLKNLFLILT